MYICNMGMDDFMVCTYICTPEALRVSSLSNIYILNTPGALLGLRIKGYGINHKLNVVAVELT